jgi:hypothetical protein
MRVIIGHPLLTNLVFHCPTYLPLWQVWLRIGKGEGGLDDARRRLLRECIIEGEIVGRPTRPTTAKRPRRSVTVNLAESPLGWLYSRGHLSRRQFDAGEKLRQDWSAGSWRHE